MRKQTKYTQHEIDSSIYQLENNIKELESQRTELSQEINTNKKQVLAWRELDLNQIKLF